MTDEEIRNTINGAFNRSHLELTELALELSGFDPHLARIISEKADALDAIHHDLALILEERDAP